MNVSIILEYIKKVIINPERQYYQLLKAPVRSYVEYYKEFLVSYVRGRGRHPG